MDDEKATPTAGPRFLLVVLGFLFTAFHLGTAYFGTMSGQQQPALHLAITVLVGGITLYTRTAGFWARAFVFAIALLGAVPALYTYRVDSARGGMLLAAPGTIDVWMAGALLICLVVMCKRYMGWALPVIVVVATIYPFIGHRVFDFQDNAYSTSQVVFYIFSYTEGVFGTPLTVAATFVAVFLIYGAVLEYTGGGQFFLDASMALFGRVRGGPAKIAVVASGVFGSINGSAVANVASTGSMTIPLMKKVGLRPHYAAAVETAASSGGQLMPPIMGAAAFILAQLIGRPYREVVIAAIVPALLYFWALLVDIDLESGRLGISRLEEDELPRLVPVLKDGWPHLISPAVLLYLLVVAGRSPMRAGLWAIGTMLLVTLVKRSTRWTPRDLFDGLAAGAQTAVTVALATAAAGVVIAALNLTGLGLRLSGLLVGAAGGNLLVLLLMTTLASIVLGMGLPTVAAYLILAVTVAPALIALEVPPLSAHMFIFYFGVMSASTPPVALAAFTAAGIAGSDPMRTAFTSVRLGWVGLLVPFLFVYQPVLLMQGETVEVALAVVSALVAVVAVVSAAQGHLLTRISLVERVVMAVGGLFLLVPGVAGDAIGYVLVVAVALHNLRLRRSEKRERRLARSVADGGQRPDELAVREDDGAPDTEASNETT